VVVVVIGIALIVGTVGSPADGTIDFELRKYFIQFLLIVALGAVVAYVVDVLKRRADDKAEERRKDREKADRERQYAIDTVTSLLDRLDAIYSAVKRKRRLFRLVAMQDLTKPDYVNAMSKLSDDKQDLDQLWREIDVLEHWLPELKSVRPSVKSMVKSMERYLGPLEEEWEKVAPAPDDEFQAESLEALKRFFSKWSSKESDFKRFRTPYYKARKNLTNLLANKRTGVDPPGSS
jgi:hypothetical protein